MIAKSRPRCVAGDFSSRSTFSRKTKLRLLVLDDPVDRPPEHALLADDAVRLTQDLRHRVVLTGEPPTSSSWSGKSSRHLGPSLDDGVDVLVAQDVRVQVAADSSRRRVGSSSRAPTGWPRPSASRRFEAEPEPAHACEEFDDPSRAPRSRAPLPCRHRTSPGESRGQESHPCDPPPDASTGPRQDQATRRRHIAPREGIAAAWIGWKADFSGEVQDRPVPLRDSRRGVASSTSSQSD